MPRYFFSVRDGCTPPDAAGTVLRDHETAWLRALRLVGEIVRDEARRLPEDEPLRIDVTDEEGAVLYRVTAASAALAIAGILS